MPEKRTIIILSIATAALLIVIAICVFLFFTIKSKNEHIASVLADNALATAKDGQYKALQRVLQETLPNRQLIGNHIIATDGVVSFIEFLERLAAQSGVSLKIDSLEPTLWKNQRTPHTEALIVNITATGSWRAVYRFISKVEEMPYLNEIQQTQLERVVVEKMEPYWRTSTKFVVVKKK